MENHHCSRAFVVATETGLFAPLAEAERRHLRRLIIAAVLHTDMSVHRRLMARAGARVAAGAFAPAPYSCGDVTLQTTAADADDDDRSLLVALLVHAADCSNPLCPPAASARHAAALRKEFATQAGKEAALGLPISVAVPQEPDAQARAEQQFISASRRGYLLHTHRPTSLLSCAPPAAFVARPIFSLLAEIVPPLAVCCDRVEANYRAWQGVLDTYDVVPPPSAGERRRSSTTAGRRVSSSRTSPSGRRMSGSRASPRASVERTASN